MLHKPHRHFCAPRSAVPREVYARARAVQYAAGWAAGLSCHRLDGSRLRAGDQQGEPKPEQVKLRAVSGGWKPMLRTSTPELSVSSSSTRFRIAFDRKCSSVKRAGAAFRVGEAGDWSHAVAHVPSSGIVKPQMPTTVVSASRNTWERQTVVIPAALIPSFHRRAPSTLRRSCFHLPPLFSSCS